MKKIAGAEYPGPDERAAWRRELTLAQRAWITFRDRDCGAVLYEFWGGSGAGGFHSMCLVTSHAARSGHMSGKLRIGQGVRLNTGTQAMNVVELDEANGQEIATCKWIDKDGKPQCDTFPVEALVPLSERGTEKEVIKEGTHDPHKF